MTIRLSIKPSIGSTYEYVRLRDLDMSQEEWDSQTKEMQRAILKDYLTEVTRPSWVLESFDPIN